jgi:hypothetical protein
MNSGGAPEAHVLDLLNYEDKTHIKESFSSK